ncbi:hypothetical protein HN954_00440 [bacterium]|jgi:hypothetical protein|nr:hypothetical protein [bacterium]MBT6832101.1 hypothetical protein [bacterium]MBT6995882.1 hypothetical protein [bacterium]MBT7772593.1 hypothetical protein [bacterium]
MISYTKTQARNNFADIVKQVKYGKKIIAVRQDILIVPFPEIDETEIPISEINTHSASFDFLATEPDIYHLNDLKKRYV